MKTAHVTLFFDNALKSRIDEIKELISQIDQPRRFGVEFYVEFNDSNKWCDISLPSDFSIGDYPKPELLVRQYAEYEAMKLNDKLSEVAQ
jgi:hypothetical protein